MAHRKPRLTWHTFAGGTGAAPGRNAYQALTSWGDYHIDPVTTQWGRHAGYLVRFANTKGKFPGGLWSFIDDHGALQSLHRERPVTLPEARRRVALHALVAAGQAPQSNPITHHTALKYAKALVTHERAGVKEMRRNPDGESLKFDDYVLRDDKKKKSPPRYSFVQLTREDVLSPDFGRRQLYFQDQQGFMARVRRNGAVKTWKRDPSRIEIPVKFGMYEAFRVTDPAELFYMVDENRGRKKRSSGRGRARPIRQSMRVVARGVTADVRRAFGGKLPRGFKSNPMSRKDFEYMAALIADQQLQGAPVNVLAALTDFAVQLGMKGNPRFDRDRFARRILQLVSEGTPFRYIKNRARKNPLAIYGANPKGVRTVAELGRVIEIRYKRKDDGGLYKHGFKTRPRLLALSDGTIAVRP